MIRKQYLISDTPYRMEGFANERFTEWKIDEYTYVELTKNGYHIITRRNNHLFTTKINPAIIGNMRKKATATSKIRYYIPLTSILDAKVDINAQDSQDKLINVDFNSIEEADNFSAPSWFGTEIVPKSKTKIKS